MPTVDGAPMSGPTVDGAPVSGTGGGSSLQEVVFGGNITLVGQNWLYGYGASTSGGSADVSQLTVWIVPRDVVLKSVSVASFRTPSDGTAVVGVFLGASVTAEVTADMDTPVLLPTVGSYQELSLGDTAIAAGSLLTIRQTAGQVLEFSQVTIRYE